MITWLANHPLFRDQIHIAVKHAWNLPKPGDEELLFGIKRRWETGFCIQELGNCLFIETIYRLDLCLFWVKNTGNFVFPVIDFDVCSYANYMHQRHAPEHRFGAFQVCNQVTI
ncbi:hypothetical protein CEXT_599321 [Caerostris extrusa]|uniref:Uncharacterized protein n=1 Tax=Caerostris extrusa TaxID=172846 RepID=A0AAV4P436_CAEEX|nr:hypothetical protein CEXT_599321 [Caerostris extrusa]